MPEGQPLGSKGATIFSIHFLGIIIRSWGPVSIRPQEQIDDGRKCIENRLPGTLSLGPTCQGLIHLFTFKSCGISLERNDLAARGLKGEVDKEIPDTPAVEHFSSHGTS